MNLNIWQVFLAVALLVVIVALLQEDEETLDKDLQSRQLGEAGISMQQARLRQFDEQGNVQYILAANKASWHSQYSYARFEHPALAIFGVDAKTPFWEAKANEGIVVIKKDTANATEDQLFDLGLSDLTAGRLLSKNTVDAGAESATEITLTGAVVLIQKHDPYIEVRASELLVALVEKHVTAKGPVELLLAHNTTTGYDLEADLETGQYTIKSHPETRLQSTYVYPVADDE